jgi:heme A synthase
MAYFVFFTQILLMVAITFKMRCSISRVQNNLLVTLFKYFFSLIIVSVGFTNLQNLLNIHTFLIHNNFAALIVLLFYCLFAIVLIISLYERYTKTDS